MTGLKFRTAGAIAMSLAVAIMVTTPADARRGGSFGSRGSRTAVAPPATKTAPQQAPAVQRTTTQNQAPAQNANANAGARAPQAAPSRFGGMAKGLIGGLIAGGLIGMLLGNGLGALGGAGMLMALLQIALIGGLIWLALRLFRRRSAQAPAMAPAMARNMGSDNTPPSSANTHAFTGQQQPAGFGGWSATAAPAAPQTRDIAITTDDQQAFERLLTDVQDAFGREDYSHLRLLTTPEIMSYLSEEMSQNATSGQRNEVTATELLEAEVAEAWTEDGVDYATIAMRYQSIDVMRDRTTGAVVKGDPDRPTETTELWTFVRHGHGDWRLSAIQEA